MSNRLSRRDFCATAVGSILVSTSSVRAGEKKYDPGASDTEIKLGQTVPHSGPGSRSGWRGRLAGEGLVVDQVVLRLDTAAAPATAAQGTGAGQPVGPSWAQSHPSRCTGGRLDSKTLHLLMVSFSCPKVGDSAGTEGRGTCSAGECSSRPSMTHVR